MKKLFLTIVTLAIIGLSNLVNAQAPNWAWAKSAGGSGNDLANSVATDAFGNITVVGYFVSPAITFGSTTLTNATSFQMFIVKYDVSGTILWANSSGGLGGSEALSVTDDALGNLIVVGRFYGSDIILGADTLTNVSSDDIFIVKYNASGTVLWAKSAGGINSDRAYSVVADASGNIIVAGHYNSPTIIFGADTMTNVGSDDMFIAKYDASGTLLWAKSVGGSDGDRARSVTADASGYLIVAGFFKSSTITFGTITLTNAGSSDMFIVKYDPAGTVLLAKSAGESSNDEPTSVTADASGNLIVAGYFHSPTITFGSITLTKMFPGYPDLFIVKYDATGTVLWAKSVGGGAPTSMTADVSGNLILAGYVSFTTMTFGSTTLTNSGSFDMFTVKYDVAGNVLWAKSAGGINSELANSISADSLGNLIIVGCFGSPTIDFGTTTLTNANSGNYDVFVAKLNGTTGIDELQEGTALTIAPNPFTTQTTITFSKEQKNTTIKIMDVLGKEIKDIPFNGKQLILEKGEMREGLYFVQVLTKDFTETKKMIVSN